MCGVSGVWECVVQVVFVVPARAGVGLQRAAPSLYAQISRSVERAGAGRVALLLFFWGGEVRKRPRAGPVFSKRKRRGTGKQFHL